MKKEHRGVAMLTLASLVWGTTLVAQSLGMAHIGPFAFNAARFFIGALVLLPLIALARYSQRKKPREAPQAMSAEEQKEEKAAQRRTLFKGAFSCGLAIFVTSSLQQAGLVFTTVGKAGFITALYIVTVPLLGLFFGRKAPRQIWFCILLATFGLYLLCIHESLALGKGDFLVLLCAFSTAAHILLLDHFAPQIDGLQLSCLQYLVCSGLSLVLSLAVERTDISDLVNGALPILYTGFFSCGVAYTLQTLGQRDVNPVLTALLLSLESAFAAFSAWAVLGERLSGKEITGCALIFAAILLSQAPALLRRKPGFEAKSHGSA